MTDPSNLIARALNSLPKYVASTTLDKVDWNGTTIVRDVATEVPRLKSEPGKPIFLMGSSGLAQTLLTHNLIDEHQLWLHPVVLGRGKRLFRDGGPRVEMRLVDSRTSPGGLVILTYAPRES